MHRSQPNPERGIALIAVMFALLLLTGIAMGLMYMAETETSINYNYRTSQMAYFASKAGLEEVRIRLLPPHPITGGGGDLAVAGLPNGRPGDPNSVVYILNPRPGEVVDPTDGGNRTFDNELCHLNYIGLGLANTGYNTPCISGPPGAPITLTMASLDPYAGTVGSMAYKWVRLTRKVNNTNAAPGIGTQGWVDPSNLNANEHVCWNGRNQQLKPGANPSCEFDALGNRTRLTTVMVATSLAIAQNGSRRMVSTEIALNPPLRTNGAVESEDEVVLNGQLLVSGYDNCRCDCVKTSSRSGGTTLTCTDRVTKAACTSGAYSIYSNDVVDDPNKSETLVAPTTPPVAENAPWEQDIPQLIEDFKNAADAVDVTKDPNYNWTCTGYPANCGTHSDVTLGTLPSGFPTHDPLNPGPYDNQITYVPGDLKVTSNGSMGSGVLVVDGDLEINGGLQFFGIIIVKGVVSFTGGGSANTNIIGSVLAGKSSIDNTVLGGSAVIKYDQCALSQNEVPQPPRTIAFREQAY